MSKMDYPRILSKKHNIMEASFEIHLQELYRIQKIMLMWLFAFFNLLFPHTNAHSHTLSRIVFLIIIFHCVLDKEQGYPIFYLKIFKFLL